MIKKAHEDIAKIQNLEKKSLEEIMILFTSLIRDHYCTTTGKEAIELLASSDKLVDVCIYSLEDLEYNISENKIVIREWKNPLELSSEFRGFVWNGSLNAICPYYHWFFFPNLIGKEIEIKTLISKLFEQKIQPFLPSSLKNCQVDFAFIDGDVMVIEINPFDGKGLGSFPISTGLFLLEDKQDLEVIQKGPLELRIRMKSLSNQELKFRMENSWKEVLKPYI